MEILPNTQISVARWKIGSTILFIFLPQTFSFHLTTFSTRFEIEIMKINLLHLQAKLLIKLGIKKWNNKWSKIEWFSLIFSTASF